MSSTTHESGSPGLVEQASSELGDVAQAAKEKAGELTEQGRGRLGEALDGRTTTAGRQSRQTAQALRRASVQMRAEGAASQAPEVVEGVAEHLERLGAYLERTRGDALLHDAEDLARRRPWLVAGAGLLVGLAVSRVLKASAERRYGDRYGDGGTGLPRHEAPYGGYEPRPSTGVVPVAR